ncbi:MAG: ferredoxin family 2Fe-2S iron-sulfur cluster binding protein [Aeromonas sp.]
MSPQPSPTQPTLTNIIFKTANNIFNVKAENNTTLLDVAHKNKIDLEGACEGSLACSTCHVILDKETFKMLGEPSDREYDLIDQAFKPTLTSRLGCQIRVCDKLKDKTFFIPTVTRNFAVDGFKPKPH